MQVVQYYPRQGEYKLISFQVRYRLSEFVTKSAIGQRRSLFWLIVALAFLGTCIAVAISHQPLHFNGFVSRPMSAGVEQV